MNISIPHYNLAKKSVFYLDLGTSLRKLLFILFWIWFILPWAFIKIYPHINDLKLFDYV